MFTILRLDEVLGVQVVAAYESCQDTADAVGAEWEATGYARRHGLAVRRGASTKNAVVWLADHSVIHPTGVPCAQSQRRLPAGFSDADLYALGGPAKVAA